MATLLKRHLGHMLLYPNQIPACATPNSLRNKVLIKGKAPATRLRDMLSPSPAMVSTSRLTISPSSASGGALLHEQVGSRYQPRTLTLRTPSPRMEPPISRTTHRIVSTTHTGTHGHARAHTSIHETRAHDERRSYALAPSLPAP